MVEEEWPGWRPISEAPKNRSIRVKLRDGRTCLVRWGLRHRPGEQISFWSVPKPIEMQGWCHRNLDLPIDERDIEGWIDPEEAL